MAKKKTAKAVKRSAPRPQRQKSSRQLGVGVYVAIGIVVVLLLLIISKLSSTVHVLGAQTGPALIARGGDDSGGGDSSSGDSNSGSGSSGSNTSGSGLSGDANVSGPSNSGGGSGGSGPALSGRSSIQNTTLVDCVGPDGRHITVTFKACSELNNEWHHSNFVFTPLSGTQQSFGGEHHLSPNTRSGDNNLSQDDTKDSSSGSELNRESQREGDLNDQLGEKDIEVTKSASDSFELTNHDVRVRTNFPLSIDPVTHELTVTTPNGTKTVAVLPAVAINQLLLNKVFTSVQTEASSSAGASGSALQTADLTEVNNEPVFAVNGISEKKVLGIIPVGFAKTAFVSTTTGNVVKTDESLLNKILEAISF